MRRVKDVLLRLLPDEELESAKDTHSGRVTRQFTLNLASKKELLLGLSSTVKTKLLRHEQNLLTSEAALITFLNDDAMPEESDPEVAPSRALSPLSPPPSSSRYLSPYSSPLSTSRIPSPAPPTALKSLPSTDVHVSTLALTPLPPLTSFLPVIIHHEPPTRDLGYHYTIYDSPAGFPLSTTECTEEERYAVNVQLGQLAYNMATITSPNGTFGPVLKVLGASDHTRPLSPINSPLLARSPLSAASSSSSSRRPSQTASPLPGITGVGSPTWDVAFNVLFESILRDGEDLNLNLPFPAIRRHIERLSHVLKTITVPRLLLYDAGDEDNILVSRSPSSSTSTHTGAYTGAPAGSRSSSSSPTNTLRLSAFRDMTTGIFGDPLLSSFWEDWDGSGPRRRGWGEGCKFIDKKTLPVRLMLYRCYRACVDIVREYYRPRTDSSEREMVARGRLAVVLRELDVVVGREADISSPAETPQRDITNSLSLAAQSETNEPATPKRTKDEALPEQKTPPRKKAKLDPETDPAEADDERADEDQSSDEDDGPRYQPQSTATATEATARANTASLDYILNS